MRIRFWLRVIAINFLVLAGLLGVAEIGARLAYPEFTGHIHSATKLLGVNFYKTQFQGFPVRVPYPGYAPAADKPLFVVIGDSISDGYGMAYEDTYWVRLKRLAEAEGHTGLEFLSVATNGNNLVDSANALASLADKGTLTIRYVLYQFNLNDITPYNQSDLHNLDHGIYHRDFFRKFAMWRYEYLNHSTFLRVMEHYSGMLARRRNGSCEERGLDALGAYTWSYGSIKYKDKAEAYWREFETNFGKIKHVSDKLGAGLIVFISPLVFDVDRLGTHPHFNPTRLDFSCATIEPRTRLAAIAAKFGINLLDPAAYLRERFEARVAESNFTPFFFAADENHFTPVAAGYIAEFLESRIFGLPAAKP